RDRLEQPLLESLTGCRDAGLEEGDADEKQEQEEQDEAPADNRGKARLRGGTAGSVSAHVAAPGAWEGPAEARVVDASTRRAAKRRCCKMLHERYIQGTKERRNDGTKERRNQGTKEPRNQGRPR